MSSSYLILLREKKFLPLFLTQFFGAFNDNAFKLSMLTLISYHLTQSQGQSEWYQAMAGVLFIFPFFILSATAGQLADKYDKTLITRLVKVFELMLMLVGSIALFKGNIPLMMLTLMGMGIHSTFFGPIKYAILLDHLPEQEIMKATGLIEGSTFIAILFGTTLGSLAINALNNNTHLAIFITVFAAFAGLIASLFIPTAPSLIMSLHIDLNPWTATRRMLQQVLAEKKVLFTILTISWFWLLGAVLLTKLPDYTHYILGGNTTVFAVFLALFSIGIALGSLMITSLLRGRRTLFVVPLAMLALSLFMMDLYWVSPLDEGQESLQSLVAFFSSVLHWRIALDLFLLALCAGLFVVPLYTHLQMISHPEARARTIAANNIYNSLFMVLGTLLVMILVKLHLGIAQVFLILALLNALAALGLFFILRQQHSIQSDQAMQ